MIFATLEAIVGLGLLVIAGDSLVRGAAALAETLGVPPLVIGLTVVAFGTSAPELFVAVEAVMEHAPTLALGNVVGSNIANALLVVGIPALIAPLTCGAPRLNRNMAIMLGSTALFIAFALNGPLVAWHGMVFLTALGAFLLYSGRRARKDPAVAEELLVFEEEIATTRSKPLLAVALVLGGFVGLAFGADMLVDGSVVIARTLDISEAVIGLTLVALGTSLPELATGIAAALRGHCDVALGNVIGSNIFNLLGIMGVALLVGPVPVPESFLRVDLWVMLGASIALLPFTLRRGAVRRRGGVFLVIAYLGYIGWLAFEGAHMAAMAGGH